MIPIRVLDLPKVKENQFLKKKIEYIEDIVSFFPRKYYDFRKSISLMQVKNNEYYLIVGDIIKIVQKGKNVINIHLKEEKSNKFIFITFFNMPYILNKIRLNSTFGFCGKVSVLQNDNSIYPNTFTMINPISFSEDIESLKQIKPIYSKIQGMSDNYLIETIEKSIAYIGNDDLFDTRFLAENDLISYSKAIRYIHSPNCRENIEKAKERFLFEDLFKYNYHLIQDVEMNISSKYKMLKYDKSIEFMKNLPFELTEGQRLSLRQMSLKMKNGERLNALVQGDVGSGKTIVAMLLSIISANNGYQSVIMCPTLVLAKQHYKEFCERIEPLGYKIGFLSGETTKKNKNKLLKEIKEGSINILVGTHAVISKNIEYKNLAMVIVDEEHRFGVVQREKLAKRTIDGIHKINMSATPIPRSLALGFYGDSVDIVTIKTLPKGRKPIKTSVIKETKDSYGLILDEIKKGRQCYVVCPLIEECDLLEDVESVEETKTILDKYFVPKGVRIGVINGKMKSKDVNNEITKFLNKEYDIIISTTIIEVGINVPNSTVILIKNAERFGLSQLHQLRGRVGRSIYQSYCLMQSKKQTALGEKKLKAMCETTDGFKISEKDLEIRGAGNIISSGTSQSGENKYMAQMMQNPILNNKIRVLIKQLIKDEKRNKRYKKILNNNMEN